jgi:hypothetical protein
MLALNVFGVFNAAPSAAAAGTSNGAVSFSDGTNPITGGGSANFNIVLPGTAACPGSGADGYRWQGFIVAASVDPGALVFGAGPQPVGDSFVSSLVSSTGQFLRNQFPAAEPVGLISGIPAVTFSSLTVPGVLPVGSYKVGIACTRTQETLTYWSTTINVTQNNGDSPAKIAWSVQTTPPSTTTTVAPTTVAPTTVAPTTVAPTTTIRPTTTTVAGATTTTVAGATTTTVAGATTTTVAGATTTTVAGATTTSVASAGPTTTLGGGGSLPATGSSPTPTVVWGILLLVFGRMAMLLAKPVRVLPPKS